MVGWVGVGRLGGAGEQNPTHGKLYTEFVMSRGCGGCVTTGLEGWGQK